MSLHRFQNTVHSTPLLFSGLQVKASLSANLELPLQPGHPGYAQKASSTLANTLNMVWKTSRQVTGGPENSQLCVVFSTFFHIG
jgi:hypothetical protein